MLDFLKKSLANRLLFSFLFIGFLPFVIFLVYTLVLSETQIVKKLIADQYHQVSVIDKLIDTHLNSLSKEVSFLSRLEIMDDILAEDIDKRISRLLKQKKDDYALDLDFFVLNNDKEIISSSDTKKIDKHSLHVEELFSDDGKYFSLNKLYIYHKIYASFDTSKHIGYLLVEYNLDNLNIYLSHEDNAKAYMYNPNTKLFIAEHANLQIYIKSKKGSLSVGKYLVVYEKMGNILDDWYIFYALEKKTALEFFYNFILFMLYLSPFILVLIVFISWKFSRYIVKPIKDLTILTDDIVHSKDYSKYLDMVCEDEIGKLAHSFNILLNKTDKTINASEAKTAFISNMSHELKTPLNAIIGFSQYLISYEKLSDEQLDIVSNIENSSQYLLEMIHGILDIAKIEAGKVDINLQDIDISSTCRECFTMLEPLAQDKDLKFEFIDKDYNFKAFKTDEKIFKQILINILSNAIKYTQSGSVTFELYNTKDKLYVRVLDTGIGIKEQEMDKLFKEFSRIENKLSSKQKGTGLGLSLSKKLSNAIDGDIVIQSDGINLGTEVIFVLRKRD